MADSVQFKDGFGARVRVAVRRADTSVRRLQKRLKAMDAPGSSYANICKVMAGTSIPNALLVLRMAEVLDCDPGWLLAGRGNIEQEPMSDEEAAEYGLEQVPAALRNNVVQLALDVAPRYLEPGRGLDEAFDTISELTRQIRDALLAPFSGRFSVPEDEVSAEAILSNQLRVVRWAATAGQLEIEPVEQPKRPAYTNELFGAWDRGEEPPKVEVGRLSGDQRTADELSEAHKRKARQTETKEQAEERRKYVLAVEERDSTQQQAGEQLPNAAEPRPNELGSAVLGDKYTGPPVPPPEELTPEQKKALAERTRLRKVRQKEAAKRDQQRS